MTEIKELQQLVGTWADSLMPNRTAYEALCKLVMEEIPELSVCNCDDPEELADVLIIMLDLCYLKGFDAGEAIRKKMEKNKKRTWKVDHRGLLKHVKESA